MISFGSARRARVPVLAAVLTALAGCSEPPPPAFTSKTDKFRAAFPSDPRVIDQPPGGVPLRLYSSRLYTVDGPNGAYTVNVIDLPRTPDGAEGDKLLDEAKADLFRSVGGTQTEGVSVALAGTYPGRAFIATATRPKAGLLRGRVYLAGARLYKVTVFGTDEYANSDAATAFLESFVVLE